MSVRHIFLALLTESDLHGYDLKQRYDQLMLHETELNFGQVYSTLLRLKRDGLIVPSEAGEEDDKKTYVITERGRQELQGWLLSPGKESLVMCDPFSYKLAAMQILDTGMFLRIVKEYRKQMMEEMRRLTQKKLGTPKEQTGALLLLDRSILKLEADIVWTGKCLEQLEKEETENA